MNSSTTKVSFGKQRSRAITIKKQDGQGSSTASSSSLTAKLAGDAAIGTGVTFLMAPFLTLVDRAICQRAAGTHTLMRSCQQSVHSMVTNPLAFARNPAFLYVWAVYAATYSTANSLKTLVDHQSSTSSTRITTVKSRRDGSSLGTMGIFLGTTAANTGASLMKDRAFAHMFAANKTSIAKKVPVASYGLWLSRDLIGVGFSFVLPDLIARKLSSADPNNKEEFKRNRDISQFCVPIVTQLVAGPLHLLGLDLFNRPMQDLPWKRMVLDRSKFLLDGYAAVVGARIARVIPGYGFGGVLNTKLRENWREYLLHRDTTTQERPLPFPLQQGVHASRHITSAVLQKKDTMKLTHH